MDENVKKEKKKKSGKKKTRKWLIAVGALAVVCVGGFAYLRMRRPAMAGVQMTVQTAKVTRMDISSELSASSSLSPKDTYEVTSLVEGEVLEALFEEGDVVEKDQVLYVLDASSMDTDLSSAQTSLLRAKENVETAQEEYDEAVSLLSGNTYKSTMTGYIKKLYIDEGDKVNNGTKIADIYDDSTMKITVPFLSGEAAQIQVGNEAVITLEDTGEQLPGVVTIVSSLEEVLSGGRLVKAVTIEVSNPGGLTTLTQATVSIGSFVCSSEGTFTPKTETVMAADLSGNNSLEVGTLQVAEGSYVAKGTPVFTATSKSAERYVEGFSDSLDNAKDSLENAENKLTNMQDTIDNYTITAPISGTVITKNAKVGDKITKSNGGSSTLCVLYDLSAMTLQMSVDELDVRSVKTGQEVTITADAIEGEVFSGTVTNVSLQSSYSQGVTNYPVTITMTETGELLPGMNVDAVVTLEKSENALCIPVGALMRGNRVYVKSDSETASSEPANSAEEAPSDKKQNKGDASNGISQNGVPDGFVAVQVETGVINDDYVEIISGLSEGDEVYIDPSAAGTSTNSFQMGMFGGDGMPGGGGGMSGGGGMPGGGMSGGGMGQRP